MSGSVCAGGSGKATSASEPEKAAHRRAAASAAVISSAGRWQSGHRGRASAANSADRYGSRSVNVASVERLDLIGARRSTATAAAIGSSRSTGGRSSRSRNCRA